MPNFTEETGARGMAGEVATLRPHGIRARVLAELVHEVHVNVGGTNDGTYSFTVATPASFRPVDPATVSFVAVGQTADQITTGLADNVAVTFETIDGTTIPLLNGVVRATANLADDDVEIVATTSGMVFTVVFTSNPNTNMTQATVVDATTVTIPVGVAMVAVDDDEARLPAAGDTAVDILGGLRRGKAAFMADDVDGRQDGNHHSGDTLEIVRAGDMWVLPEEAVVPSGQVFVRLTATGNEQQGAWRTSQDGTAQVTTATPTALNSAAYELTVDIAEQDGIPAMSRTFNFTADASATATEICDGFRTAMALDLAFTARVVATGTVTLILTSQELGITFTVLDTQDAGAAVVGAWASITDGTPAVSDCVLLDSTVARWLTDGNGTTPAKLSLNLA